MVLYPQNRRIAIRRAGPCGTTGRLQRGLNRASLRRVLDPADVGANRANLKRAGLHRAGETPTCGACPRLQSLIPGTVALWQFQNTLSDTSGNGYDLFVGGPETYVNVGGAGCLQGLIIGVFRGVQPFRLAGTVPLLAALTGEVTVSFLIVPNNNPLTAQVGYVMVGGFSPSHNTFSAYKEPPDGSTFQPVGFQFNAGYPVLVNPNPTLPAVTNQGILGQVNYYVFRRDALNVVTIFIFDTTGNLVSPANTATVTPALAPNGTEVLNIGFIDADYVMTSLRILNYARSNADI